jgi:hypothetical protein
MDEVGNVF